MAKKTNGTQQSNESIIAPTKIKTVDDLRNTVKAKLEAEKSRVGNNSTIL